MNKRGLLEKKGILLVLLIIALITELVSADVSILSPSTGWCYSPLTTPNNFNCINNITNIDGIVPNIQVSSTTTGWVNTTWSSALQSNLPVTEAILNSTIRVANPDIGWKIQIFNNSDSLWINVSGCDYSSLTKDIWYNKTCNLSSYITTINNINSIKIRAYAYRTSGGGGNADLDYQSLIINYNPDINPPTFSNYIENPANNSAYVSGQIYGFNSTISDNNAVGSVWIEFNGINYTSVTNISSVYSFNRTNLGVGTYSYRWWANDSVGNYNTSELRYYTVNKATPILTKLLNGQDNNLTIVYPQQINASGSTSGGSLTIYRDGLQINNGENYSLGVGYYRFEFNVTGNENYTNNYGVLYANITKATGAVYAFINHTRIDFNSDYLSANNIYLNGTLINGIGVIESWLNGTRINLGSLSLYNVTNLSFGYYNFTVVYPGNENYTSSSETWWVNITDIISPSINIILPEAKTYGYNTSLPLNFSVSDINLDSCWYNLNSGENITVAGCQNATFNASDGSYTLYLYANDTLRNSAEKNVSFSILTTAPAINLLFPKLNYLNYQQIYFNYSVSGVGVSYCGLWGNWAGVWHLNQTNSMITQENNFFILNLTEGNYNWGIVCNDSQNRFSSINSSFSIDTSSPIITITEPKGTKTSKTAIPLIFSVNDISPAYCWYNIRWSTGIVAVDNTTITNCSGTSFSVSTDGDYVLNLFANDSASNLNYTNSSFSVSTSSNPPGGGGSSDGGGGGGGGGGKPVNKTLALLEISGVGDIVMKPGEIKTLSASVKNTGSKFSNNCKLVGEGEAESWISSKQSRGLSPGEVAEFIFSVSVPEDVNKDAGATISIVCDEVTVSKSFKISLVKDVIDLKIKSVEQKGSSLDFVYSVKSLESGQEVSVEFWVSDEAGKNIANGTDSFSLESGQELERTASLELPSGAVGEHVLSIKINSEKASSYAQETVLLGSSWGFLGRALLVEGGGRTVSIAILIVISVLIGIVVVRRIIKKPLTEDRAGYVKIKLGKHSGGEKSILHTEALPQSAGFFSSIKKSLGRFSHSDKRGIMVIDNQVIEHLKKHAEGKDLRGKWIHIKRSKR